MCYNLPLHTHEEDHFHHPQILKLASGSHTECILNRDKKHNEIYQKRAKKLLKGDSHFTIHTSYKFKNWNVCLNPKLCNKKRNT